MRTTLETLVQDLISQKQTDHKISSSTLFLRNFFTCNETDRLTIIEIRRERNHGSKIGENQTSKVTKREKLSTVAQILL